MGRCFQVTNPYLFTLKGHILLREEDPTPDLRAARTTSSRDKPGEKGGWVEGGRPSREALLNPETDGLEQLPLPSLQPAGRQI